VPGMWRWQRLRVSQLCSPFTGVKAHDPYLRSKEVLGNHLFAFDFSLSTRPHVVCFCPNAAGVIFYFRSFLFVFT
jgi:hypothetical protein